MFGFRIQTLYVWLEILCVSMWSFLKKHNLLIFTNKWSLKHPPKWGKNSMQRLQLWFHIAPLDVTRTCSTQIIRFFGKNLQGSGNIIGCLVETCGVWRCWHFFCALDEELVWDLLLLQTRPSFCDINFTTAFFPRPQGWMSFLECQKKVTNSSSTIFWCHDFQGSPLALEHFIWNILYIYTWYRMHMFVMFELKHLGHLLNQSFTLWSYWKAYHWLVRSTIVWSEIIATWV